MEYLSSLRSFLFLFLSFSLPAYIILNFFLDIAHPRIHLMFTPIKLYSLIARHLSLAYIRIYAINIRHRTPHFIITTISFRLFTSQSNRIKSRSTHNNPTYTHHLHLLSNNAHSIDSPSYWHSYLRIRGTTSFTCGFLWWFGGLGCVKLNLKILINLREGGEIYMDF